MKIVKAPNYFRKEQRPFLFLAGSIEMGEAENWQQDVCEQLKDVKGTILNPRRDDWDSTWIQTISNPQFCEQVNWELDAMEDADYILMHFEPETKSPITLLELGLFANSGKIRLHCPEGFWRKGNVDIVASRNYVKSISEIQEFIDYIKELG